MSDCNEIIKYLSDYIDGTLDPELCRELEEQLGGCDNCRLMVDHLEKTVKICRDGVCAELPQDLQKKLNSKLEAKWKEKFGAGSS